MTVRKLDSNGDWTFGNSRNDLIDNDDKIAQNVVTRLKSFKNDWFLDIEANIDWLNILGSRNNEKTIVREIFRVAQETEGVWKVPNVEVTTNEKREATIGLTFLTTNSREYNKVINL